MSLHCSLKDNRIYRVIGDDTIGVNQGRLCSKGRFGYRYVVNPERINRPLIKKDGGEFKEATWEEALEKVAQGFKEIKEEYHRSVDVVLNITGEKELLDHNKNLQRSLSLRNPYIDPISFIQVNLIKKFRTKGTSSKVKTKLLDVLRASVNGVAAGIRNTG